MSLESVKKDLPPELPFLNTLDLVAKTFGGPSKFIAACKVCGDVKVVDLVTRWEQAPRNKKPSLTDLCKVSDIDPAKLLGLVVPALFQWNASVARMLMAAAQPFITQASIESAQILGPDGFKDRERQLESVGLWTRQPGSPLVNINLGGEIDSFEDDTNQPIDVTSD